MAARRYWRLRVTEVNAGTSLILTELEMYVARGGANQATGGTPFGSAGSPANAFDGSTASSYTAELPAIIGYDFGAGNAKDLTHIIARCGASVFGIPFVYFVESSDDNSTWTIECAGTQTFSTNNQVLYIEAQQPLNPEGRIYPHINLLFADASRSLLTHRESIGPQREQAFPNGSGFVGEVMGPRTGIVGVFVREAGTPVEKAYVRLHRRRDGAIAGGGWTDATGYVQFNGLDQTTDDHYAVALDPDGGTVYNALIYDRVTPS